MRRALTLGALVAAAAIALIFFLTSTREAAPDRQLGLFTSLPILWQEADDLKGVLDGGDSPHWARTVLETRGRLVPLDTLLDLSAIRYLIVAQPRPLSPDENVSLDAWLRSGGRLLVFADPMLTYESQFALGDRRRPQDIALISPILARWGLELRFDDAQRAGERELAGESIAINLAGEFVRSGRGHDADCRLSASGLIARCRIGKGRAILVADAALLERDGDESSRVREFSRLLDEAFES